MTKKRVSPPRRWQTIGRPAPDRKSSALAEYRISFAFLKEVIRFPFRDRDSVWRFVIGSAILAGGVIIPLLPGFIANGYVLRIMRQAAAGERPRMSDWDDIGGLLSLGFRGSVLSFVFFAPAAAVFAFGIGAYMGMFLALPLAESTSSRGDGAFLWIFFAVLGAFAISLLAGSVLLVLAAIPLPMATAHLAVRNSLGAGLRPGEWWPLITANKLGYLVAWAVTLGLASTGYLALGMMYYTVVLICLVPFLSAPFVFYVMLVGGALFGYTYTESAAHEGHPAVGRRVGPRP